MTLKIIFYLIIKKTTIMHNIYIYTHKNLQLLRWYAMILIYRKSDILLQLQFLWSLNSNLQINKLGAHTKCQELKVLIQFILHHHLQSKVEYVVLLRSWHDLVYRTTTGSEARMSWELTEGKSERGIVLCPNLAFKQETWNTVNREG